MRRLTFLLLCIASYSIPLATTLVSIATTPWFSLWDNALSDLGHSARSCSSPVFNFGLAIGGFLMSLSAFKFLFDRARSRSLLLVYLGFSLILIAVFDEAYGLLHFIVSVMFFVGLITYLLVFGLMNKNAYSLAAAIAQAIAWAFHLYLRVPRGAAIPELVSVSLAIPFYTSEYLKLASAEGASRA